MIAGCGVFAGADRFDAAKTIEALGLRDRGGLVRAGSWRYDVARRVDAPLTAPAGLVT